MRHLAIVLAAAGALSLLAASVPAQARPRHPVKREHVVPRHARVWRGHPWHHRRFVVRRRVPIRRGLHIVTPNVRVTIR